MNEIIDNSQFKNCKFCKGNKCSKCKNTGVYKEEHYIIISNGIAFDSDMKGK